MYIFVISWPLTLQKNFTFFSCPETTWRPPALEFGGLQVLDQESYLIKLKTCKNLSYLLWHSLNVVVLLRLHRILYILYIYRYSFSTDLYYLYYIDSWDTKVQLYPYNRQSRKEYLYLVSIFLDFNKIR